MVGVTEAPVDVQKVAEALGFEVLAYPFPETTSGLTFIEAGIKCIGYNQNHAPVRQRFSIAHELGHYLSGHEPYDHGTTHVEGRPSYLDPQNRLEVEANEFAAELLMPDTFLRRDVAQIGLDVPVLAKRFGVSEQAMWIQIIDLGLASRYPPR
ncbi:MAG TPA: ImmA/IrrE family metallo-endopeptidase [Candidatus Saccharimonadales bacterium]|nr:ImmA/IrrE family metallo-endopeptidase [Candidatus Saccharimonadales bacterium]